MGRRLKRGKVGNVAQYLTRTKAIRKLQLRLSEFRRLCILKGIHPREPKKKVKGANKTYYHMKDINWLLHEPLLQIFRNMKSHERKVRKAKAKFNPELAQRLRQLAPTYKLDHLVKERYPSFVDALRDLDDPLTMMHLFATLPAEKRYGIPVKAVDTAKRLALEWSAWLVRCHALRKVFVSVKGIYFQAEVLGQAVTWLVPHQLAQVLPTDVDYKVMVTFLEFYECMLQFVNFKLYHSLQLNYPPVLDAKLEAAAAGLAAVMRELAGVAAEAGAQTEAHSAALQALAASTAAGSGAAGGRLAHPLSSKIKQIAAAEAATGGKAGPQGPSLTAAAEGGKGEEEEEEEEVDSEAGSEEEGEGEEGDDSEGEEEEGEEEGEGLGVGEGGEEEGEATAHLAARRASGAHASTSTALGLPKVGSGSRADGAAGGEGDEAGLQAAGGALGRGVAADDDAALCASLFRGVVVFLAREVPREALALVIRAFGGVAAWDGEGSPHAESSEAITHQVVDRPTQGHRYLARQYVQPQWVFDSANFRVLMPVALYGPGKVPPPHLSPFVNDEEEGYTPDWAKEVKRLQEAARLARMRASGLLPSSGFVAEEDAAGSLGPAETDQIPTGTAGAAEAAAEAAEKAHAADLARELKAAVAQGSENGEDAEDGMEAEVQGSDCDAETEQAGNGAAPVASKPVKSSKRTAAQLAAEQNADEAAMKDIMMTRKNRKLYERINRSVEGKRARTEALQDRKKSLAKKGVVGEAGQLLPTISDKPRTGAKRPARR